MSFLFSSAFQLSLFILVVWSFVMVIGVPVAYASPQNWDQSRKFIWLGSIFWAIMVIVVGSLNYFVA